VPGDTVTVSFANDIQPIFIVAGCLSSACHGGTFPSSQYDMGSHTSAFESGELARRIGACEIVPGDPEASFLMEKLTSDDPRAGLRMPLQRAPLSDEDLTLIETWIREGALDN
jgi:hypothetical protein